MTEQEHARMEATNGELVVLQSVAVALDVVGMYVTMTTTQHYKNPTDDVLEVRYTFPLPAAATLLGVEFVVRGKRFVGQVHPLPKARTKKEKAVAEGDTALLVTHSGGLYVAELGNVGAGEAIEVVVRSAEFVVPNDGTLRVAVPTTIAPRYGDPRASGLTLQDAPETSIAVEYPFQCDVQIHGVKDVQVTVPSHIAQITTSETGVQVGIRGATMDRDVVMLIGGYADYRATVQAPYAGQHWYASFVHIPTLENVVEAQMHVKLLVDCSGSMSGTSIVQARSAVTRLLSLLRDGDSIAVTRFGTTVEDVTPGLMTVGKTVRTPMQQWLTHIEADLGGTETVKGLTHVLEMPTHDKPCVVIVLTDGEAYGIAAVADRLSRHGHAVYPLVIGYTPADGELRKLASATGGFCESVTPNERIDDAMMRVVRRIRSVPVAESSLVCGEAVRAWQSGAVPQYRGSHQLLTGAMDRSASQELIVEGESYPLPMIHVPDALQHDFVRTVAASHLQNVTGQFKIDWAVTHQLVTDETAVVAIAEHEADKKVIGTAISVKVQQQMANDWHGGRLHAVMHAVPQSMPRYSSPRRAVMDLDVDAEFETDAAFIAYSPIMDQPDRMYVQSPSASAPVRARGAHRFAALIQDLLRQKPDVTTITLADLLAAGFDSDMIDAWRSIAGYGEEPIVLALCVVVLGNAQAKKLKLSVDTVPVALLGGLKVIIGA